MRHEIYCAALLCSLTLVARGQQGSPQPNQDTTKPVYGSVIGRVTCSDTNDPARLATVTLLPIEDTLKPSFTQSRRDPHTSPPAFRPVQTMLDGSFNMPRVAPGYYYVVVQYPGYVSPTSLISPEQLAHPTAETQKLIANVLPTISVSANRTTAADIRIQRGASISGTIRFDDGTPAPSLAVRVLHQDESGKWVPLLLRAAIFTRMDSNDLGYYRLAGLPAGEYIVEVRLNLDDITVSYIFGSSGGNSASNNRYSISVYSGGKTREKDAKRIRLHEGEDDSGEDIVIPVSKLHPVSGMIVQARNGQVINAGRLALLNADDKSEVATAKVDPSDSAFHFAFVPEGTYILKVVDAHDVSREEVPYPHGSWPATHIKETTLRSYGSAEQTIIVQGDMSGIVIPVPDQSAPVISAQ